MKPVYVVIIATTVLFSTAEAEMSPMPTNTIDVAAGRNLRNTGMRFCSIHIDSKYAQRSSNAMAVILLPSNARLLDTRIITPSKTLASCASSKKLGANNIVNCKLSRLTANKSLTLRARYHQKIPSGNGCTAYIQASNSF